MTKAQKAELMEQIRMKHLIMQTQLLAMVANNTTEILRCTLGHDAKYVEMAQEMMLGLMQEAFPQVPTEPSQEYPH